MIIPADLDIIVFTEVTNVPLRSCPETSGSSALEYKEENIQLKGSLKDILVALNNFHGETPGFWHTDEQFDGFRFTHDEWQLSLWCSC